MQARKKEAGSIERAKGNEFYKAGETERAIECYTNALKAYTADAASYANRALCKLKLRQYQGVIQDANKAIEIDQDYIKAYHRRGKAYMELGEYQQALGDFEECIMRNPRDPELLQSLA